MVLEEIKSIKATTKEARKFGLTIGAFLLAIAGFLLWKQRPGYLSLAYAGIGFTALGLVLPILLKPIYKVWMSFAVITGFIMTRAILTILYIGMFTPIAVTVRLLGKDLLGERWNKSAATYWVKRPATPFQPRSAERMF